MSPEGTRAANSANRTPGYNNGGAGGGRGMLPYNRNYMVAGGLVVAGLVYYGFYSKKRPFDPNSPSRPDANTAPGARYG